MIDLGDVLRDVVDEAQQSNKENPKQKTADGSLFDKLREMADQVARKAQRAKDDDQELEEVLTEHRGDIEREQRANEESEWQETADPEVFVDVEERIEREVRKRVAAYKKGKGHGNDKKKGKDEDKVAEKYHEFKREYHQKVAELTREFQKKRKKELEKFRKKVREKCDGLEISEDDLV